MKSRTQMGSAITVTELANSKYFAHRSPFIRGSTLIHVLTPRGSSRIPATTWLSKVGPTAC